MPSKVVEVPGVGNVEFPDTMSDNDIGNAIKKQQDKPPEGVGENILEAAKTGYEDLGGAISAVLHPKDTVKSLVSNSGENLVKAKDSLLKGNYEDALNSAGRSIPVLGNMVGDTINDINSSHYGRALTRMGELGVPHAVEGISAFPGRLNKGFEAANDAKITPANRIAGHVAGFGLGEAMGHPYLGAYMGGQVLPRVAPFVKGFMGDVASGGPKIGELPKAPQLTLAQMQDAVKSGAMSMDDLQKNLVSKGYKPDDINTITQTLQPKTTSAINHPNASKVPTMTSMTPAQMERAVINNTRSLDDYRDLLVRKRMVPADVEALTEDLKRKLEDSQDKEEETSKLDVKSPVKVDLSDVKKPETPQVFPPGHESFLENEQPHNPPLTDNDKENLQSTPRAAKENTLAQHMVKINHDLTVPPTAELLKSIGKDAGLKYEPSLRTYESAVKKAKALQKDTK